MTPRHVVPALLCVLLLAGTLAGGCRAPARREPGPATAGAAGSTVHADFRGFDVIEVAVVVPQGDVPAELRMGLRQGLYETVLDRAYSPLDPDYVDAATLDLRGVSGPSVLESVVTDLRGRADGVLVSGWAALTAPSPDGGEAVYVMELTDYFCPAEDGADVGERHRAAGLRLGRALLSQLPSR